MRDTTNPALLKEWQNFLQVARLGLHGKTDDLAKYLRRISATLPGPVAEELRAFLNTSGVASRSENHRTPSPSDSDSRLSLLRIENAITAPDELFFNPDVTAAIEEFVHERHHAAQLIAAGINPPTSLIFWGPPGVGKTKGAQLLANRLQLPLLTLDLSAVISSYLGKTGQNVRYVLDYAKSFPSVLLLDEFDSIAQRRDANSDSGELRRLVNIILQEIEEWSVDSVLLAATNHPELLDPAVWRRFHSAVKFDKPDVELIGRMLATRTGREMTAELVATLSEVMLGCSHAEVDNIISKAKRSHVLTGTPLPDALIEILLRERADGKHGIRTLAIALSDRGRPPKEIQALLKVPKSTLHRWIK